MLGVQYPPIKISPPTYIPAPLTYTPQTKGEGTQLWEWQGARTKTRVYRWENVGSFSDKTKKGVKRWELDNFLQILVQVQHIPATHFME